MTYEHALEVLAMELGRAKAETEKDWKKRRVIEALKVSIEVLHEKIEEGETNGASENLHEEKRTDGIRLIV